MATDWFGQGISPFFLVKKAEDEGGYNYYGRMRRNGLVLIVREELATGEVLYANGNYNFGTAWNKRASLTYKRINEI